MNSDSNISLAWRHLSVHKTILTDWKHFGRQQTILNDIHGSFHSHSLNALAGPSGSGKTTLLKALSGLDPNGFSAESEIFIRPTSHHQPVSYFIEQDVQNAIHGELTVKEALVYAFQFKNGITSGSNQQLQTQIDSVISKLLLKPEVLGRQFRHLSGGEQKRVVIGQELMGLRPPDFIFCDELTTGLDSYAALEVIRCLSLLASAYSQLSIIVSIHAPSDELLECFSQLYVLAKGGVPVYSGPPSQLTAFLCQTLPNYDTQKNAVETLIHYACDDFQNVSPSTSALVKQTLSSELLKIQSQVPSLERKTLPSNYKSYSFSDQFVLLHRQLKLTFITQFRAIFLQMITFLFSIAIISFFFSREMATKDGCLRRGNLNDTQASSPYPSFSKAMETQENFSFLYFNRLFYGFAFALMGTTTFHSLVGVFRSEHRNRWYSSTVFFISTQLTYTVRVTVFSVVITTFMYFIGKEHAIDNYTINWHRFLAFHLLIWLKLLYGTSLGEATGVLMGKIEFALGFTSCLYASHTIMDNNFVKTEDFSSPLMRFASDAVGHKYFVKMLVYIFYGLERCDGEGDTSWFLKHYHIDRDHVGYYVFRMVLYIVLLKMMTYMVIMAKFSIHWKEVELPNWCVMSRSKSKNTVSVISNSHYSIDFSKENFENKKSDILLAFTNLTLYPKRSLLANPFIRQHHEMTPILQNLNGQFNFGTLNAIMGMSGAGKTSLLKVLTGQNGSQLSPETTFYLSRKAPLRPVYIAQHVTNALFLSLTAKQALVYSSMLKNANESTKIDHETKALELLEELAMPEVANRKIELLSGGEQKRLVIAQELTSLKMPNLLCFDEPTSGLDSSTAEKVISILKSFAESHNIAIIASIHQPNTRLLHAFHSLYILSIGGVCLFSEAPSSLRKHLCTANISVGKFPIETAIKVSCAGANDPLVQTLSQQNSLHNDTSTFSKCTYSRENILPNRNRFRLKSSWILLKRYLAYIYAYLWIELAVSLVFVVFYGYFILILFKAADVQTSACLSFDADFASEDTIEQQFKPLSNAINFCILISIFFITQLTVIFFFSTFVRDLPLFENEHRNGWYSTGSWFITKSFMNVFPLLPLLALYTYIVDIFDRPGLYPHLLFNLIISSVINQATNFSIYLLCRCDIILTCIIFSILSGLNVLLSNSFIPLNENAVLQFLSGGAAYRHTLEALFLQVYGFGRCKEREVQPLLENMNLTDADYPMILLKLVLHLIFWHCLTLYLLVKKVNYKGSSQRKYIKSAE